MLDNGNNAEQSKKIEQYTKDYLRARYEFRERDLIYNKWNGFKYE
jgi:hypothetical protein